MVGAMGLLLVSDLGKSPGLIARAGAPPPAPRC
jgi:hypothetical protein